MEEDGLGGYLDCGSKCQDCIAKYKVNRRLVQEKQELEDLMNSNIFKDAMETNLKPEVCVNYITKG